ncbi:hypothetical protein [Cyanobium sp. ATX 6F1]|uniref:hypothetical protein n=1 Tax=unclassified Cyanobium TaxID=2627006 RepID=UPI0020CD1108|nr:hypothetical protein [Cyanobium sp. ATX 6F1]
MSSAPSTMANAPTNSPARQAALIDSLRLRYSAAVASGNADAKLALFKEAAYLDIKAELLDQPAVAA